MAADRMGMAGRSTAAAERAIRTRKARMEVTGRDKDAGDP
jgi:hypothetical protein